MTSARIFQSVVPSTWRPTGPAAAEASAPILNLLASIFSMPWSFITSMTTSMASPPICKPQLPPVTVKGAGALHPEVVRQVATPLPCRPPKTKPILTIDGMTARHFAESSSSSGIPLSGVPIISSKTVAAASIRLTCSDGSSAATASVLTRTAAVSIANIPILNLIAYIPLRGNPRDENHPWAAFTCPSWFDWRIAGRQPTSVSIPHGEEGKGSQLQRYWTRQANTIHRPLYEEERFTVATQANFSAVPADMVKSAQNGWPMVYRLISACPKARSQHQQFNA